MTWVRLDDTAPMHPKLMKLSDGALRLWINGLSFANRAVTDGRIDKALVASLNHHGKWTHKQIAGFTDELVGPLWIDRGDHYEIHEYEHHQAEAMKERVERKRAAEREKKRKQREESDRKRYGVTPNVPTGHTEGHAKGHPVEDPREAPREASVPSRPVPSRSDLPSEDLPPTPLAGGGAQRDLGLEAGSDRPTVRRASAGDGVAASEDAEPSTRPSPMERFLDATSTPAADVKLQDEIAKAFDRSWRKVHGVSIGISSRSKRERERLAALLAWARDIEPKDPVRVVERAAEAFAVECKSRGDRGPDAPFPAFCSQPGKHLAPFALATPETAAKRQRLDDEIHDLESRLESEWDPDEQLRLERQITERRGELRRLDAPEPLGACA